MTGQFLYRRRYFLLFAAAAAMAGNPASAEVKTPRIGLIQAYLVAVIDWASRAVLAWRLSNTRSGPGIRRRIDPRGA